MQILNHSNSLFFVVDNDNDIYAQLIEQVMAGNEQLSISFDNIKQLIHFGYFYLLPFIIYQAIASNEFYYAWINPLTCKNEEMRHIAEEDFQNGLFDAATLGSDIATRGSLFPFFGTGNSFEDITILLGKHRWCAMQQNGIDKDFLFLSYTTSKNTNAYEFIVPVIDVEKQCITIQKTSQNALISYGWMQLSNTIASLYKQYYPDLVPLDIFNYQENFKHFITKEHYYFTFLQKFDFNKKI